jgi:multifunctional 2-oxoglutarate metabolism enzyme
MFGGEDRRGMRKPLVIFTPKSLLRHPAATSTVHDLTSGGFQEVIDDPASRDPQRIARVVFCSGKIYYDLLAAREERKADQIALVRLEQLYPFAHSMVNDILLRYPQAAEAIWAQEEPRNMGPWRFLREQIQPLLDGSGRELRYVGRSESASPATGSMKRHQQEQSEILDEALTIGAAAVKGKVRLVSRRKAK